MPKLQPIALIVGGLCLFAIATLGQGQAPKGVDPSAVTPDWATDAAPNVQTGRSSLVRLDIQLGEGGSRQTIVAMHGMGDTAEHFSYLLRDYPGPAKLLLPQAPTAYSKGWSWFPTRVAETGVEVMAAHVIAATDEVSELLQDLIDADPAHKKVVVTGFSQGGMLSYALAVRHPEQVGLAIPVSGWLPEPLWPDAPPPGAPPIRALHGERDRVLPLAPTLAGVEHLKAKGWDAALQTYAGAGHAVTPPMLAELWRQLDESPVGRAPR